MPKTKFYKIKIKLYNKYSVNQILKSIQTIYTNMAN